MLFGLELGDKVCQLSYMENENAGPQTLSTITNQELYEIPVCIARDDETGNWVIGRDAIDVIENKKGEGCNYLYRQALLGETISIAGVATSAKELLALFVKRLMALTTLVGDWKQMEHMVICVDELTETSLDILTAIVDELGVDKKCVDFISKTESFYEYMLHQREELWNYDVVILDYSGEGICARSMVVDRHTRPAVCHINERIDATLNVHNDRDFLEFCQRELEGRIVTSVYLIGEAIPEDEIKQTLRYLCMKRRVFAGKNLYTKGACWAAYDRRYDNPLSKAFLFLGRDKLKSNIGVRVVRGREEIYESLVDAGINWYDVHCVREFYLDKEREVRLLLTPLTGKNEHYALVRLADFSKRPSRATRIRMTLSMTSDSSLKVTVDDLGFGEIFPSEGLSVTEVINIG